MSLGIKYVSWYHQKLYQLWTQQDETNGYAKVRKKKFKRVLKPTWRTIGKWGKVCEGEVLFSMEKHTIGCPLLNRQLLKPYIYSHSTSTEQHIIFIACDNLNKKWWFFWRRTGRVYWEGFWERGEKCYNLISQFKGESWGVVWGEGGYILLDVMRKIYHGIKREHWSRNIDCGIFFLPSTGLNIKDDTHLFTMKIAIKFINLKLSFYFNH